MKVRELLQIEIWSKKASQRLVFGVLAACLVAFFGWKAWRSYQFYWLTDGERRAARIALQEIDKVQKANAPGYEEFDAMFRPARTAITAADAVAVTERDQITVMQLESCELEVTSDHLNAMLQEIPAATQRQIESKTNLQQRFSESSNLTRGKCEALHKALY
jgi:predicted negative regulator of RcsB-dependent stress response